MARSGNGCEVIRRVTGLRGNLAMRSELRVRMDYGSAMPWVTRLDDGRIKYIVGPDRLILQSDVPFTNEDMCSAADFSVAEGEQLDFVLGWSPSFREIPPALDVDLALQGTADGWSDWAASFAGAGEWSDIVLRSLITLKALDPF